MDRFLHEQPDWSKPATLARYRAGSKPTGYWAVAGWALLQMGSTAESRAAAGSIRAAALAAGRAWPFSSGDAGQLILLESGDAGYLGNVAPAVATPQATPSLSSSLSPQAPSRVSPSSASSAPSSGTAAAPRHRGRGGLASALLVAAGAVILGGGWWLRRK